MHNRSFFDHRRCRCAASSPQSSRGFTLIEMLIAMAITLLMMVAVVTVFANVSDSIRNRRAAIEVSNQVRHVREVLQGDLAAATCPALPTQRVESNHGYIELIEGPQSDFDPSIWLRDTNNNGEPDSVGGLSLDLAISTLPGSNLFVLPGGGDPRTRAQIFSNDPAPGPVQSANSSAVTDGRGLGDWDDILAFTARNENEPFVGRIPNPATLTGINTDNNTNSFANTNVWGSIAEESQLAEVIWYAVENPIESTPTFFFGEAGFRTIYRRALLIAPQLNFAFNIAGQTTGPGVVRVLRGNVDLNEVDQAIASLIAFQERYDLSVRLEWDPQLDPGPNPITDGRWTIIANSLSDLTKRENRYEHYGFITPTQQRRFPFAATSLGAGIQDNDDLEFIQDPELTTEVPIDTDAAGEVQIQTANGLGIQTYTLTERGAGYSTRPFVYVDNPLTQSGDAPATVRAIVNEDNEIVQVVTGYVPLSGDRRGQDVMLTDVLAFDMRVYDPDAPLLADNANNANPNAAVEPGDAGWGAIVRSGGIGGTQFEPEIVGRGAYVDLGYFGLHRQFINSNDGFTDKLPDQNPPALLGLGVLGQFSAVRSQLSPITTQQLLDGDPITFEPYRVYDTWSFHYENNGINEDNDTILVPDPANPGNFISQSYVDEGTDGLDVPVNDLLPPAGLTQADPGLLGPDDAGELETLPPYNAALRGVQVTLRAYERDSRQVREVKVHQTFVPQ